MISPTVRRGLMLLPLLALAGCNTVVLNPSGDIAAQQGHLVVVATLLMLLIIVPVIALTLLFAWRYRQSNTQAKYDPDWDHSTKLELVIWGAPLLIIIVLGLLTWISTHLLDPFRPLSRLDANRPVAADVKPLVVQVVALDWKWLFIYPEQGIATVNELVTPVDVPVRFQITASTVMNAFYIPALAGQIYAMPGMQTTLNAVINKPGEWEGFSANYSGAGFSHMRFKYRGVSQAEFGDWIKSAKSAGGELTRAGYQQLAEPSEREPVRHYGAVDAELFSKVVNRCVADGSTCINAMMAADAQKNAAPEKDGRVALNGAEICVTPPTSQKTDNARPY
ncbi:ubiquinol oxidase subunit II [Duganella sp. FT3S]|uniref:Ubiquinol oxidase subunit 2 n=1 Tax=Rugamonas fusca TaxID=2758568 RepID=A0A7W2EHU4_9BURK|nr:ubiquinol oxidase subunit II [Rugamonas fusca]MBA5606202.1 ubiquinol oxidase subunit II [Rugamonas fusca]HJV01734.1 ubiquinol oxidase subunit II [Burkholderiaceae bacterium]